jgi:aspartyl-tRNA(Asn)/glutamyl-tRNA(Gln) amidotransferase subunit A
MAEINDDILFATIREQATQIKERKLSPVELTEAYLDRLERYGEKLGAVVTITRELALKQAREAEQEILAGNYRGLLHGIPYGAKDLLATKGIPTTWGAEPYRNQKFDYDATVVAKLRAAGAILVAKLAMVELAGAFGYGNADASFTGPGRTPWNLDYWSGGSSAGSGAATAAGLISFAIGSETSGSIITPAAYCGIAGLRPTYGRVSRHGAMALCWTMDKLGPMARSADCCGIVLAAIVGKDPNDASSVNKPFPFPEPKEQKKFKVGILKNSTANIQKEVRQNFEESVKTLGQFCDFVEDLELPKLPFGSVVGTIVNAEGAAAFRDLLESGKAKELRAANDKWGGYAGLLLPAVDYLDAMRLRGPMKREMEKLYAPFDAIISPARGTVALPIDRDFFQAYPGMGGGTAIIPAGNAVGQPALSIPNGFGLHDLPTGIQFTGRAWSEARLIAIAHAYQELTDWHKKRPPFPEKD